MIRGWNFGIGGRAGSCCIRGQSRTTAADAHARGAKSDHRGAGRKSLRSFAADKRFLRNKRQRVRTTLTRLIRSTVLWEVRPCNGDEIRPCATRHQGPSLLGFTEPTLRRPFAKSASMPVASSRERNPHGAGVYWMPAFAGMTAGWAALQLIRSSILLSLHRSIPTPGTRSREGRSGLTRWKCARRHPRLDPRVHPSFSQAPSCEDEKMRGSNRDDNRTRTTIERARNPPARLWFAPTKQFPSRREP